MKINLATLCLFFVFFKGLAQNKVINLWDVIPNSQETTEEENVKDGDITRVYLVKEPTLEIYLPAKRNAIDKAVLICPGGGYHFLSYDWEGTDIAKWFNSKGIDFDYIITSIQSPKSQINKRWVYVTSIILLLLVIATQRSRKISVFMSNRYKEGRNKRKSRVEILSQSER